MLKKYSKLVTLLTRHVILEKRVMVKNDTEEIHRQINKLVIQLPYLCNQKYLLQHTQLFQSSCMSFHYLFAHMQKYLLKACRNVYISKALRRLSGKWPIIRELP